MLITILQILKTVTALCLENVSACLAILEILVIQVYIIDLRNSLLLCLILYNYQFYKQNYYQQQVRAIKR